ncbi:GGDEF domain-containing protein [Lacticaseibacillus sharpeae]|uniref:Signal transduction diguanylate cyclase n=1 Tax=Lacticaseibacillus sharpeae JCM 1186 = DSM 20505 TaxID=1291052 RepID=A0A0R1ZW07_9LACO|nr:diguanylate cyclase [Lacticaseibacillus sharpeae]KRM56267.1 Signal transduction diguanylate cyclase [Lacticaseibacillus sharpeae JCM 1186 = DSM 20505]
MEMSIRALATPALLVQLVFACFYISGFVTYYQHVWHRAFRSTDATLGQRRWYRIYLIILALGIGNVLHFGGYTISGSSMMYHNVGLFVVAFPLLDGEITLGEFAIRALGLIEIWVAHHAGNLTAPQTLISFAILAGIIIAARKFQQQLRFNVWWNFLFAVIIATSFWFSLPSASVGVHVTQAVAWQAVIMFLFMNTFTCLFWISQSRENRANAHMRKLASYDQLTNAATYTAYQQELTEMFTHAQQTNAPLTLVSLDIDHFKQVNDHYGHLAGNAVLIGVATTLSEVLDKYGNCAQIFRTGGEEFNIALPGQDPETALPLLKECWATVRKHRYHYEDVDVAVTLSMGVTAMHSDDRSIDDTYKRADDNLFQSKHAGRDTITIEGVTMHSRTQQELVATYTFFTQGIVDITTPDNARHRSELLLRMYDNVEDRWQLPDRFDISVETQINLIERVLANSGTKRVAINLTLAQFVDQTVATALTNFKASTHDLAELTVEITDVPDVATMRNITPIYRASGVRIDIDDVGSDNSYELVRGLLPYVDGVKFAMQNLRQTNDDQQLRERVDFWVGIAKANNLEFVLEGVENAAEVQFARDEDISLVQGYFFSKPGLPTDCK